MYSALHFLFQFFPSLICSHSSCYAMLINTSYAHRITEEHLNSTFTHLFLSFTSCSSSLLTLMSSIMQSNAPCHSSPSPSSYSLESTLIVVYHLVLLNYLPFSPVIETGSPCSLPNLFTPIPSSYS